jgi:hypothetical protein
MNPSCGQCKFFAAVPTAPPGVGLCMFNPPAPAIAGMSPEGQAMTVNMRPQVRANEWCGRWTLKLVIAADAGVLAALPPHPNGGR